MPAAGQRASPACTPTEVSPRVGRSGPRSLHQPRRKLVDKADVVWPARLGLLGLCAQLQRRRRHATPRGQRLSGLLQLSQRGHAPRLQLADQKVWAHQSRLERYVRAACVCARTVAPASMMRCSFEPSCAASKGKPGCSCLVSRAARECTTRTTPTICLAVPRDDGGEPRCAFGTRRQWRACTRGCLGSDAPGSRTL